jgi:hypothetical protein
MSLLSSWQMVSEKLLATWVDSPGPTGAGAGTVRGDGSPSPAASPAPPAARVPSPAAAEPELGGESEGEGGGGGRGDGGSSADGTAPPVWGVAGSRSFAAAEELPLDDAAQLGMALGPTLLLAASVGASGFYVASVLRRPAQAQVVPRTASGGVSGISVAQRTVSLRERRAAWYRGLAQKRSSSRRSTQQAATAVGSGGLSRPPTAAIGCILGDGPGVIGMARPPSMPAAIERPPIAPFQGAEAGMTVQPPPEEDETAVDSEVSDHSDDESASDDNSSDGAVEEPGEGGAEAKPAAAAAVALPVPSPRASPPRRASRSGWLPLQDLEALRSTLHLELDLDSDCFLLTNRGSAEVALGGWSVVSATDDTGRGEAASSLESSTPQKYRLLISMLTSSLD